MGFEDEWIQQRTGIKSRGIADVDGGETLAYMASQSAEAALNKASMSIDDIDLIIFSLISSFICFSSVSNKNPTS